MMKIPRFMIAAAASGSGKTTISCGLMQTLKDRNYKVVSGKCGPDYIDPMFHREVLGVEAENLDLFFCERMTMRRLFAGHVEGADIAVLEGVMGYYDGMMLESDKASSYDVAQVLKTPVILAVPCKGMALSVLAVIKGMIAFRQDSNIQGIILNRVSAMLYPKMKKMIETGLAEAGCPIPVVGYVPEAEVFDLESRHLGLVTPQEIRGLQERIKEAGRVLAETVDLDQIIRIAGEAPELALPRAALKKAAVITTVRIGIAQDAAFGFYYKDNLNLLRELGCELIPFSPLRDKKLPSNLGGLILGGGYPELYADELAANTELKIEIRAAVTAGMPCLAECGGFMYLHEKMEGADGGIYEMAGVIKGTATRQERLVRFGYINITGVSDGAYLNKGEQLRGHEFHYWDSDNNGTDCLAEKPNGSRSWQCIHASGNLFAGYPHIHYHSTPGFAERFAMKAKRYKDESGTY